MKQDTIEYVLSRYTIDTKDCWVYQGCKIRCYGHHKRFGMVHRLSYTFHKGEIPVGLLVCHHCDNPPCINPDHLFLGNHHDNRMDAVRKGRAYNPTKESQVVRDKLSKIMMGNKNSLGRLFSVQEREAIRKRMTGRIVLSETKEKLRNINLGKKASEATKIKMSLSQTERYKIKPAQKGIKPSENTIIKMSQSHLGKKHTEATKLKMSLFWTNYWATKRKAI